MNKELFDALSDEKKEDVKLATQVLGIIMDNFTDVEFAEDGSMILTVKSKSDDDTKEFVLTGYNVITDDSPEKPDL